LHILYAAAKYDYGDSSRGLSFEHCNFFDTLEHLGHDITYFDTLTEVQQRGPAAASRRLLDVVKAEKPHLLFCSLMRDELKIDVVRRISADTDTTTFNWFCDDHWRFDNFCIGQGHVAQVPDESYADHPTAPDADATISPCIDA